MKDISKFGSADYPIHPSGIRGLLVCPWRSVMRFYAAHEADEAGPAADTGSAMHAAAAAFHRGKGVAESLQVMQEGTAKYPRADLTDAAGMFLSYAADPRNSGHEFLLVEQSISFTISPAEDDPTQAPIQVDGTVDHVRREAGRQPKVWDIKTSKKEPLQILQMAAFQAAAYCVGASIALGEPVSPGGVILPRRYKADGTGPVFWHFPWTLQDTEQMLEGLRRIVSLVRRGVYWHVPNEDCCWCPARSPDLCLPKLQEVKKRASAAARTV